MLCKQATRNLSDIGVRESFVIYGVIDVRSVCLCVPMHRTRRLKTMRKKEEWGKRQGPRGGGGHCNITNFLKDS